MRRLVISLLPSSIGVILMAFPHVIGAPKRLNLPSPAVDSIDVVAQLLLTDGPVVQLVTGEHWRRHYLYVEHGSRGAVMIVDVTDPKAPKVASEFALPTLGSPVHLSAMVGTGAMVSTARPPSSQSSDTMFLMSFADPVHPKVLRQFSGVTCLLKDSARGLIYLTNAEGLWVLRENPATDVELQKQYEHDILYNH